MDPCDARLDGIHTVLKLRQHPATGMSACHERKRLLDRHFRDQRRWIIRISIDALDIRQKHQFLRLHRFRNCAGRIVRIDVIGMVDRVIPDRTDDRNKVIVQQCIEQLRVDTLDIPDITDVLPVRHFSRHLKKASVLAGDTAGLHPDLLHQRNQALVDPVQHHLDNIHRLIVRHTEPCLEL